MANHGSLLFCYISSILMLTISLLCRATGEDRKVYIVYMGSLPNGEYSPLSNHLSMLQEIVGGSFAENPWIRSYKRSFNGFVANLTDSESQKIANRKEVVSVFRSTTFQLHTTRSWDFIGFPQTSKRNPAAESDVIVGVIDSGIWPESESFDDEGFGPAPKKWKGACRGGKNFTCNNKIIGARYYSSKEHENKSARDDTGHGSHTASTAAGNKVKGVSFFGLAKGTARGGVPLARIAAYKVCFSYGECPSEDVLAAFDDAIADGVDIISISLGSASLADISVDPISIGSFHAMEKGILTSHSAGNDGPEYGSVVSVAPWLLSVAASSIDRRIIDKVVLGNSITLVGNAVNAFSMNGTIFPLIDAKEATKDCKDYGDIFCVEGCLDSTLVKGKIVLCDVSDGDVEASRAGALGSILKNDQPGDFSFVVPLPSSALSADKYDMVMSYAYSTKEPQGTILKSEVIKDGDAPKVLSFSSRGPNPIAPDIMKPDVSAPGADILAAYSPIVSPSNSPHDKMRVKYSILSGTSMACPHASGAAAYVKTFHPSWSPSAIKSALMTTASLMDSTKNKDAEFAYGSGQINPTKAINPGLVYEALAEDYIKMLCSLGYDTKKLRLISGDNSSCPKDSKTASSKDLNYPSMAALVSPLKPYDVTFHRTLTNVGLANSTYKANIFFTNPCRMKMKVYPQMLSFNSPYEKKSFVVSVAGADLPVKSMVSASLVWSYDSFSVRSPIIVHTN